MTVATKFGVSGPNGETIWHDIKPTEAEKRAVRLARRIDKAVGLMYPGDLYRDRDGFKAFVVEQRAKFHNLLRQRARQ
jgi:hypothetical protein